MALPDNARGCDVLTVDENDGVLIALFETDIEFFMLESKISRGEFRSSLDGVPVLNASQFLSQMFQADDGCTRSAAVGFVSTNIRVMPSRRAAPDRVVLWNMKMASKRGSANHYSGFISGLTRTRR